MSVLVQKPLVFVTLYLGLACLSVYPVMYALPFSFHLAIAGMILCVALQAYWTFLSLQISSSATQAGDRYVRRGTYALVGGVIFTFAVLVYKIVVVSGAIGDGAMDGVESLLVVAAMFSWFSLFWLAARSLCNAESQKEVPTVYVFGTFLLFIYMAIGAFFLSARLRKLKGRSAS